MTVEVTSEELKQVLQDADVQALIVQKLSDIKTTGLADALTAQYKSLGIITDNTESVGTSDTATDASATASETESTEAAA